MKYTVEIDQSKCVGCTGCTRICPQRMLKFDVTKKKAFVDYSIECDERFGCVKMCPVNAIKIVEAKK